MSTDQTSPSPTPTPEISVDCMARVNFASAVELLTDVQLARLIATTPVVTLETAKQELGESLPKDLIYEKGTPSDKCTLILSGKVTILVGAEDFRSDVSSWSVLGKSALEHAEFSPDFTAFVSDGPCRCLQISHGDFVKAVDASAIERTTAENKAHHKKPPSITSIDGTGSVGDNVSAASSEPPNRREKLLARLYKAETAFDAIATDGKDPVVRFEDEATSGDKSNGNPETK